MIRTLQIILLVGMLLSLSLLFTNHLEAGTLVLILTPLFRNTAYGLIALKNGPYLFAFFAFLTVAIILFT